MRRFIYPYMKGSESVKNLSEATGYKRIKLEGSKFKESPNKLVINWGSTTCPYKDNILNDPDSVAIAKDKLKCFDKLRKINVNVPEYTTDKDEVCKWNWGDKSPIIYARETLTGNSGQGITVIQSEEEWDNYDHNKAKMYTKFVRKGIEFRFHVFKGYTHFTQRKCLRTDEQRPKEPNFKIRNHENGFIFANDEEAILKDMNFGKIDNGKYFAQLAVAWLYLDFGAVDMMYSQDDGMWYLLEVNTAPGLTGKTLEAYKKAFEGYSQQQDYGGNSFYQIRGYKF